MMIRPFKQRKKLETVLLLSLLGIMPSLAWARKGLEFIPPPFMSRVLSGLITLSPIAAIILWLSFITVRPVSENIKKSQRNLLSTITALLTILGSVYAATNDLNDELLSPANPGGHLLALIFPLVVLQCAKKLTLGMRIAGAILSGALSLVLGELAAYGWQLFGWHYGIPTTW